MRNSLPHSILPAKFRLGKIQHKGILLIFGRLDQLDWLFRIRGGGGG